VISRGALRALAGIVLAPVVALLVAAAFEPLPQPLRTGPGAASVRVLDRNGRSIRDVRAEDGAAAFHVGVDEVAPSVVLALLAAEDARFHVHPGIDPLAMLRAAGQLVAERRLVSGASTLTQQLARSVVPRPRTLGGKLREMAVALRIEASLSKRQILEEYLNRVEFGPNLRGIEAASRHYFDKPSSALDLSEAATLAAIPRGPALYDPRRGTERVQRRRDRILERMRDRELAASEVIDRALAMPVVLQRGYTEGGTHHLVRALASGALTPELGEKAALQEIRSTIDAGLQREVEGLVRQAAARLERYDASSAAVLVVDNVEGDVLAYVGSPDFFSQQGLGQNDGTRALRQPGSTLKPFVYAAAIQRLGMSPATLLPDVELHLPTAAGDYAPRNYDGLFHGPVRLREALASSLNVPAVWTAERVGAHHVLELLRAVGFTSLAAPPEHYGAALALGDGEVTLAELATAYSALARGGTLRRLRFARAARRSDGELVNVPLARAERVLDPDVVSLVTDMLSDDAARSAAFGPASVLALPFPTAAKTGTSKGFRDNWTVGYTRELTVAVWVGNFDGRPMRGTSGVTGAGPLFREVMLAAMRGRERAQLFSSANLEQVEICALSGERAGADCPHRVRERFRTGQTPAHDCSMHVRAVVDERNQLRAGPGCRDAVERVFERYQAEYTAWAIEAHRPLLPSVFSPHCPGSASDLTARPSVGFPFDGARFLLDPALGRDQQQLVLSARGLPATTRARFVLDGQPIAQVSAPFTASWRMSAGQHVLHVETPDGARSDVVRFSVR
jgi:penicillin-binding protein 1C